MVTHATSSILEYADRCIVLDGGRILDDSTDVLRAVLAYEKNMLSVQEPVLRNVGGSRPDSLTIEQLREIQANTRNSDLGEKRFGTARAIIESVTISTRGVVDQRSVIRSGDEIEFRFLVLSAEPISEVVLGVSLSRTQGGDIWGDNNLSAGVPINLQPGETDIVYRARLPVSAGEYLLHCGLACLATGNREELDQRRPATKLTAWSQRAQVGVVFAPIEVSLCRNREPC
jgi:lipopolysaccharide transport system ATP-binding protein